MPGFGYLDPVLGYKSERVLCLLCYRQVAKTYKEVYREGILKLKESIPPAYVALRAFTTILFLLGSWPPQIVLKFQQRTFIVLVLTILTGVHFLTVVPPHICAFTVPRQYQPALMVLLADTYTQSYILMRTTGLLFVLYLPLADPFSCWQAGFYGCVLHKKYGTVPYIVCGWRWCFKMLK